MAFDLLIKGGTVYDGRGGAPVLADVAIQGDVVALVGDLGDAEAAEVIDAAGFAVAPGFINLLSHSYFTVLHDPRSLGELKQGVTTQLFGEGWSMGPLTDQMQKTLITMRGNLEFEVTWTRLSEYLSHVEKRGVSQNVASLIGATTIRIHVIGYEDRSSTLEEQERMEALVEEEMADGAFGIGSALIYAPGSYAPTKELIGLCRAASRYQGKYFSHLRSEGNAFLEGVQELVRISREAELPAEIWHLKASGRSNWPKMQRAIEIVEEARSRGEPIAADMYTYTAGATSLAAAIPPRFHEGGFEKLLERLADTSIRGQVRNAIETSIDDWENLYRDSAGPEGVLILSVRNPELRHHQGRTLAQIAQSENKDPIDALMDLVVASASRVGAAYFIISEDNLKRQLQIPWVSFGSDAGSMAPEGVFLESSSHPRSYGTFARLLGRYVRDEGVVPLPEAIRRLTTQPAEVLGLDRRGRLAEGFFADVVVFDPAEISDRATYESPHQFAVGVRDVVVNGTVTLRDGEFTGNLAGRALWGPGKRS